MTEQPTSPLLRQVPRSQAQALRDIMDRRANSIQAHAQALADAAAFRRYLLAPASLYVAAMTGQELRNRLQAARTIRLSANLGARLP